MFHIVCGTYESPLYGYKAHLDVDKNEVNIPPNKPEHDEDVLGGVIMEQLFAYAPHSASIRAAAAAGEWLVTSSADESLKYVQNEFLLLPCSFHQIFLVAK